jgi:hypothetical protein
MPRFHPLIYRIAPRDTTRDPKLHQLRDLCAGLELASALHGLGFRLGRQIFNQPPRTGPRVPPAGQLFNVDISFVRRGDVFLHFTRPPIHDIANGNRRIVHPAYTDLEKLLFAAWKRFLAKSSREHMVVHGDLSPLLAPGFEYCREMSFKQNGWGAPYYRVNPQEGGKLRLYKGPRKSIVFVLRLAETWPGGPGLVSAWGMDGCTTLALAHRLATDKRAWLEQPGFRMAELGLGKLPEHVTDLSFCESWPLTEVLVHDLAREPALA